MHKAKLLVFSLPAVVIVSAMTTASASATFKLETPKCETGRVSICWEAKSEGKELKELVGTEEFAVKQVGTSKLKTKFGASTVEIECTAAAVAKGSVILQTAPLTVDTTLDIPSIKFTGCKSVMPPESLCKIKGGEIATKPIVGKAVNTAVVAEGVIFAPEAGKTFVEVSYEGKECLLAKTKNEINGEQICLWATPDVDLAAQELKCEPGESKLTFGAEAAKAELTLNLSVTIPELTDVWDIALS